MEDINSIVLPRLLEMLSQKPELCDTFDNLLDEMEAYLASEKRDTRIRNMRSALKKALNVAQSLGIITMADEIIRVPFSFRTDGKRIAPSVRAALINANGRSSGRKSVQPRKPNQLDQHEFGVVMVSPTKRHPGIRVAPTDRSGRRRRSQVSRRGSVGRARARGNPSRRRRATRRRM